MAQQLKMMMILMPLMFPLMLYHGPSGVNLYIMSSIGAGVIEQIVIRKHIREREEMEAQGLVPVTAKTGGGNVTVVVGRGMTGSNTIIATSGAGNVIVRLPSGIAARIHASSGMGKLAIDTQFTTVDDYTYESPDFSDAVDKIEITVESGAGDVSVITE